MGERRVVSLHEECFFFQDGEGFAEVMPQLSSSPLLLERGICPCWQRERGLPLQASGLWMSNPICWSSTGDS